MRRVPCFTPAEPSSTRGQREGIAQGLRTTTALLGRLQAMERDLPIVRLRLYVVGGAPRSQRALESIRRSMRRGSQCQLDVVDIHQRPDLARQDEVQGVPTLLRLSPGPARRLVGDLSDESKLGYLLEADS